MHRDQLSARPSEYDLDDVQLTYRFSTICRVQMMSSIFDALISRKRWNEGEVADEAELLLRSNEEDINNFF